MSDTPNSNDAQKPWSGLIDDMRKFEEKLKEAQDQSRDKVDLPPLPSGGFDAIYGDLKETLGARLKTKEAYLKKPSFLDTLSNLIEQSLGAKESSPPPRSTPDDASPEPVHHESPAPKFPAPVAQPLKQAQEKESAFTPDAFTPPSSIVKGFERVIVGLGYSLPVVEHENLRLDGLAQSARSAWVGVLTQGRLSDPSVGAVFQDWKNLLTSLIEQAPSWSTPHEIWASWAQDRLGEAEKIAPWVAPVGSPSALSVPASYTNSGVAPLTPTGIPQALEKELRLACDFMAWAEDQPVLHWKNTPQRAALENLKVALDEFDPRNKDQEVWKEKALDRCTVISARLTVKASQEKLVDQKTSKPATRNSKKP